MRGAARYLMLVATRTRAPLPALAATLFLVIGVFWYRRNEVGADVGPDRAPELRARGLAGRRGAGRRAARPGGHGDGGARRPAPARLLPELLLAVAAAALLALAFIGYPLVLIAFVDDEFDRAVQSGDVVAAVLAHLSCGVLGGAIAVLFSPPRLARRASAIAAVLAALVGLAAIGGAAGPVAVARALNDAAPGTVGAATLGRVRGLPRARRGRAGRRDALGAAQRLTHRAPVVRDARRRVSRPRQAHAGERSLSCCRCSTVSARSHRPDTVAG